MKNRFIIMIVAYALGWSGICEDNMFSHVIYGRAVSGKVLDSANWDPRDGGDWNHYSYDPKGHILKNDTTSFMAVTSDSLLWNNDAGSWSICYFPGGYRSTWNDGFGTLYKDSSWRVGDTVKWARSDYYESDPVVKTMKIAYPSGNSYFYRYINLSLGTSDTTKLDCIETATRCECELDAIPVMKFERTKAQNVLADTFWQSSSVQRVLFFHAVNAASIRSERSSTPSTASSPLFFDLLGRLEQR